MSDIDINRVLQNIKELQAQNAIDFQQWKRLGQEIEKLAGKIKTTDGHYNLLMKKIKADYEKLRKVIIDENIQIELSNGIEENKKEIGKKVNIDTFNSSINKIKNEISGLENSKTDKITTDNIQKQIDNLVLGAVGDGNNAEVVQSRGDYPVLNERLDSEFKSVNDTTKNIKNILINNGIAKEGEITKNLPGEVTNGKNMQINGLGYINIAGGDTTYNILEYNLQGEKTLKILCSYGADTKYSVGYAFCNNEDKVIAQYNNSIGGTGYVIAKVPSEATKIVVNGTSGLVPTIAEYWNDIVATPQFNYNYMMMFQRLAVIGDSLSSGELVYQDEKGEWQYIDKYGNSWVSYIARETGAVRTHYSQGGITAKLWLEYYNHRLSTDTPYNAYFIALGTNDAYKKPYPLGEISDTAGMATFVGYYRQIIENVKANAPNSVIFCCSRYSKADGGGYNAMIKSITELYDGVFFVDIANESDITLDIGGDYVSGSHFTTLGYVRLAKNIMKIVSNVILNNIGYFKFFMLNNDNEEKYES